MALLTGKKHIFFDLDDTLWDYEVNSARVLRELFEEFALEQKLNVRFDVFLLKYREINREMWLSFSKKEITKIQLRAERFTNTFRCFGFRDVGMNAALTTEYLARTPHEKCLKKDCHEVLTYLRDRYELHIITNGFNDVQSIKIENGNLRGYFRNIIVSEDHALSKPDERIFRLAEELSGALPQECVMVGDTYERDILGAINAGWEPVYYSQLPIENYSGRTITALKEICDFL